MTGVSGERQEAKVMGQPDLGACAYRLTMDGMGFCGQLDTLR